jgi:hypothetical protein
MNDKTAVCFNAALRTHCFKRLALMFWDACQLCILCHRDTHTFS